MVSQKCNTRETSSPTTRRRAVAAPRKSTRRRARVTHRLGQEVRGRAVRRPPGTSGQSVVSGVIRQDSRWGKHLQEPLTAEWLWLPDLVCPFHRQHRRVIYKSISGVRSIVRTVEEEDFERLARIRRC